MKKIMEEMWKEVPKRNLGQIRRKTEHGNLELVLIPTSRGASMFYRRDWYLNGDKISVAKLLFLGH